MPKNRSKQSGKRSGKKSSSTDSNIIASHKATGSTTNVVRSDLTARKQNFQLVQTPPRNLFLQTHWCEFSIDTQLNVNALTVGEANQSFSAGQFPGTGAFLSAFDQYCIYSVVATFSLIQGADTIVRIYTALDYDNVANIGKSGIQALSTFNQTTLTINDSLVRYVKPCIAPLTVSPTLPASAMVARSWLDSGFPQVPHYGLRIVLDIGSSTVANVVNLSLTGVFGWRNSI